MASKAGPAFLSRIAREFSEGNAVSGPAAVEFSPVEFDEYIGNVHPSFSHSTDNDESQFDVTLPWEVNDEEEGEESEHAHEEEENHSHGPQHQQRQEGQRVTPHGTMTSILSAADYTSKLQHQSQHQHQHQHGNHARKDQHQQHDMQQRQERGNDTQKHQKSLRLRAAKYFRTAANPTASCDSPVQNNDNLQPKDLNMLDERPETGAACEPKCTTYSRRLSQSPTPTIRTTNHPPYNPAKRHQSSLNKPSLAFFPRTRVASPPNPNPSSRNSPTFSIKSTLTTHTDERTEVTTAMTTISRYSDPPLSTSGMSRYSDPSLYYEDIQSQVSTSATSVSYGSDLENAARRILGRKRGFVHGDASSVGKVEKHVIDTNASLTDAFHSNRVKNGLVQRRPSRERLRKKTGRSIGIPTREDTDDETEKEEETEGEEMDVLHPLPPPRNLLWLQNSENKRDGDEQYHPRQEARHVCQRNQLNSINEDREKASKQNHQSLASPDPVKQVDAYINIHEENNMTNTYLKKEWSILPPVSLGDHNKAFSIADDNIDDDDYKKYYDDYDAAFFEPKSNANNTMSHFDPMLSISDESLYQTRQFTRASCASSLEGDTGEAEESENDCGEFNENDYFHDFGMNSGQSWEALPAPMQFCPTRGVIGSNSGYNNNEFGISQMTAEQHEDYVKSTSEIDFFAWNDEECPTGQDSAFFEDRHQSDNMLQDQGTHSFHHRTNNPNLSTDVLPGPNAPKKKLVSRDKKKENNENQTLPSNHAYPFSDGDTPTRKAKRGLNLFRSRFRSDGLLKYHSDGERLDSDLERSPDKHSFGMSPMRSSQRNKKQKVPPRSLSFFGDRHHHRRKKADKESVPLTEYELLRKDSELSNSGALIALQTELMHVSPGRETGRSTVNCSAGVTTSKLKQVTPEPVPLKSKINPTSVVAHNRNGSKVKEHSTGASSNAELHKESISVAEGSSLHADSTPKQGDIKSLHSSNRANTPVSNLNDSLLTEETPLVSNKAFLNDLPPAPSLNQSSSSFSDGRNTNSSSPLPGLPPRFPHSNPAEKKSSPVKRTQPQSPGLTGADVIIRNENVDDCSISTLQSDSLGSLVTKATADKSRRSFTSQRSGMSEIERLRKENERLREELENRLEISSRVSLTYVKALKEENEHLREELITVSNRQNASQNSPDIMYKSTIARLLERDDTTNHRRSRCANLSNSPRKNKQHLNNRKPSVPLINGANFDDESITTQSESIRDNRFQFTRDAKCDLRGGTGLLQKIATVADQIKTSTQDRNNPARERRTCEISLSKPMELIAACTRKDKGTGETTTCANTVSSGKEVIGRVLGCLLQNNEGDKTANAAVVKADSFQSTKSDSASDSLVHRTAVKRDAGTSPRDAVTVP